MWATRTRKPPESSTAALCIRTSRKRSAAKPHAVPASPTPPTPTPKKAERNSASLKRVWAREKEAGVKRAGFGGTHSDEARAKISAAKRGRPHPHTGVSKTQEQKDHQSQAMLDWWSSLTPEEREAHASKQKGRPPTKGMTGRKHTPETKRRMSEARRARTSRLTPESKP